MLVYMDVTFIYMDVNFIRKLFAHPGFLKFQK